MEWPRRCCKPARAARCNAFSLALAWGRGLLSLDSAIRYAGYSWNR